MAGGVGLSARQGAQPVGSDAAGGGAERCAQVRPEEGERDDDNGHESDHEALPHPVAPFSGSETRFAELGKC